MFRIPLFLGFSLAIWCLPSEGHAFLDKLTKELQKNLPSPTQGNNNPQNQTKNSSSGSSDTMDYKSPAILKFLCDKTQLFDTRQR